MTSPLKRGAGALAARALAGRWGPPGSGKAWAQGQVELGRGAGLGLLLRCRAGCRKGLGQKLKWAKKRKEKNFSFYFKRVKTKFVNTFINQNLIY